MIESILGWHHIDRWRNQLTSAISINFWNNLQSLKYSILDIHRFTEIIAQFEFHHPVLYCVGMHKRTISNSKPHYTSNTDIYNCILTISGKNFIPSHLYLHRNYKAMRCMHACMHKFSKSTSFRNQMWMNEYE